MVIKSSVLQMYPRNRPNDEELVRAFMSFAGSLCVLTCDFFYFCIGGQTCGSSTSA